MKRKALKSDTSKKLFKETAARTHKKNVQPSGASSVLRGGIRL